MFLRVTRKLLMLFLVVAFDQIGASLVLAQVRVASLEELSRELSPGDVITLVQKDKKSVTGRLLRFGDTDLEIRAEVDISPQERRRIEITVPRSAVQSVERRKDSTKNGALIGAGAGAGVALTQFLWAVAVDSNEMDEWGATYILVGGVYTGIGALAGWVIDAAHSKPHVRFDASTESKLRFRVTPRFSRNSRGVALSVSF